MNFWGNIFRRNKPVEADKPKTEVESSAQPPVTEEADLTVGEAHDESFGNATRKLGSEGGTVSGENKA